MKRVVIIGGGFAGTYAAKKLEKNFDVTLIDTKEYFEYTPGILRVIVNPKHIKKLQVLHSHYLKRASIIVGKVNEVSRDYVRLKTGRKISFDYLIISSGSSYDFPVKESGIVKTTRASHLRGYYDSLCKAKKVLIIGGGLVGVEMAAEIVAHYSDKEITIVSSRENLIYRNNLKTIKYAKDFLREKGVEIINGERVVSNKGKVYKTDKGRELSADLVFLCTGIKPNFEFMKKNFSSKLDEKGFIKVNETLQLLGHDNIFVVGDIASVNEEKTAQNAKKHACIAVCNIFDLEKGRNLRKYKSRRRVMLISLGKYDGIFEYGNFVLFGKIPALMKWGVEKCIMWGYKSGLSFSLRISINPESFCS